MATQNWANWEEEWGMKRSTADTSAPAMPKWSSWEENWTPSTTTKSYAADSELLWVAPTSNQQRQKDLDKAFEAAKNTRQSPSFLETSNAITELNSKANQVKSNEQRQKQIDVAFDYAKENASVGPAKKKNELVNAVMVWKFGQGQKLVNEGMQLRVKENDPTAGADLIEEGMKLMQENMSSMDDAHEYENLALAAKDPKFYTRNLLSQLPMTAPLMIGQTAAGLVGGASKVIPGIGTLAGVGINVGASGWATKEESEMEMAETYQEVFYEEIEKGTSVEEAHAKAVATAKKVRNANIGLLGATNLAQQLTVFGKPMGYLTKASKLEKLAKAQKRLEQIEKGSTLGKIAVKTGDVAGRMAFTGLQEAGEEGGQYAIQQWAQDKPIDMRSAEAREAMAMGGVQGGLFAGIGGSINALAVDPVIKERLANQNPDPSTAKPYSVDYMGQDVPEPSVSEKVEAIVNLPDEIMNDVKTRVDNLTAAGMEPKAALTQVLRETGALQTEEQAGQTPNTVYDKKTGKPLIFLEQPNDEFVIVQNDEGKRFIASVNDISITTLTQEGESLQSEQVDAQGQIPTTDEQTIATGETQSLQGELEPEIQQGNIEQESTPEVKRETTQEQAITPASEVEQVEQTDIEQEPGINEQHNAEQKQEPPADQLEQEESVTDINVGSTVYDKDGNPLTVTNTGNEKTMKVEDAEGNRKTVKKSEVSKNKPEQKPEIEPIELGRKGKAALKKWAENEYVNVNLGDQNSEEAQNFVKFFTRYYQAGYNGERIIDIPQGERNISFPPFIETEAIKAGEKDAETANRKANQEVIEKDTPAQNTQIDTKDSENTVELNQRNQTPNSKVADFVIDKLNKNKKFSNKELFEAASEAFEGTMGQGNFSPKDAYDSMELGVNKWLLQHAKSMFNQEGKEMTIESAQDTVKQLQAKLELLPTQRNRTDETDEFQQFSTPPSIAYIASWIANMNANDTVLEPSAGIGGLAVFGKIAGAKVIVNELSLRRAEVLKEMGFDQVFTENAEQINNILPKDIKPTVVIMNPPFSSAAGRVKGKNDTKNAIAHIEQALKRLEPNGRLVAILGRGMADNSPTFKPWWDKLRTKYTVQANIGINGKNYTKYGTSFDVQIVVIDNIGPNQTETITGRVDALEDIIPKLEGIRNGRPEESGSTNQRTEQNASQSTGSETTPGSQAVPNVGHTTPVSTDRVGVGERGSEDTGNTGTIRDERPIDSSKTGTNSTLSTKGDGTSDKTGTSTGDNVARGKIVSGKEDDSGSSTVSDRGINRSGEQPDATGNRTRVEIETKKESLNASETELTDAVYSEYVPQKLNILNAKPHPADLVQSSAMASVEPPDPKYTPNLPQEIIKEGKLSLAQIEAVVYAGQAHQQTLPDGKRKGFFIGDGTGVGKGREIAAIILDNMHSGSKKAVWVTENKGLLKSSQRDYEDIGGDASLIFDHGKIKNGTNISQDGGIVFTTYTTLGTGQAITANGEMSARNADKLSRLDQIVDWLGEDFDGVIAFDEAHNMQNSLSMKGARGSSKPAAKALAGVELQKRLPNAKVVYVSATGATEVENLAYADRLGLWGYGTPFADKRDFVSKIASSGLAAMELVARDMKAMGSYIARNIGFNGVNYSTLEHELTTEQREVYDEMAGAWQIVLQNIDSALAETGAIDPDTGNTKGNNAKAKAMSAFWGAQQRFFNQILTSMQMPSVIENIKEDLKNNKAVVLQLVNTNEAQLNRALAELEEGQNLEDLDMTPRAQLMMFLEKSFPVVQYEEYADVDGNMRSRPVVDSEGNMVENLDAVAMRDELLDKIGAIKVPDGPMEILFNEFGTDMVAEITGRTRRVVRAFNDETGRWEKKAENRTKNDQMADENAFMDDRKQILVFSDAGGTGRSYHADRTRKNQRQRKHYLIQAGWTASKAVQGFGRTHRSNQASAPEYVLVTTDLKGQKRFMSSIARRLNQLGALTKGQRQAAGQGLFSEKDNLEGAMASDALERFFVNLINNDIEGLNPQEILQMMGLSSMMDERGNKKEDPNLRNVPKFLNRLLTLESSLQNKVFDEFMNRLDMMVEKATVEGTLDAGMENFKADKAVVIGEETVFTEPNSGAETKLVEFEAYHKVSPLTFEEARKIAELNGFIGYYRNTRSGKLYAIRSKGTTTTSSGSVVNNYYMYDQDKDNRSTIDERTFKRGNWEQIKDPKDMWNKAVDALPEYRKQKVNLITGALLPIWDRLPTGKFRVVRVLTDDGRILLGRVIPERSVDVTRQKLGAGSTQANKIELNEIAGKIMDGYTVTLSNGWKLNKRLVSGESRIEIAGNDLHRFANELKDVGVFSERINYSTRFFIPTGSEATQIISQIIKYRPIADIAKTGSTSEPKLKASDSKNIDAINSKLQLELEPAPEAMDRPDMQAANILATLLADSEVVPFRGDGAQGLAYRGEIFLNEETQDPLMYVAKHEIFHNLREEAQAELITIAKEFAKNEKFAKYYRKHGYSEEEIWEEFTADAVSEAMEHPDFWGRVRAKSEGIIDEVINIIDTIIAKFKGKVGRKESKLRYIKDLEGFREKVSGVVASELQNKPRNLLDMRNAEDFAAKLKADSADHIDGFTVSKSPPTKTIKAYKLMRIDKKQPGKLFPLFVSAEREVPQNMWLDAEAGELTTSKTGTQKVKSRLGELAYRPGWHLGDIPLATHIGKKGPSGKIEYMNPNHVWVECEVAADKDYQPQANANGTNPKTGKMNKSKADIKELPVDGFYRYKTNPNMTGEWIITGAMKINRVLTDSEVNEIVREAGYEPLPRQSQNEKTAPDKGAFLLDGIGGKSRSQNKPGKVTKTLVDKEMNSYRYETDGGSLVVIADENTGEALIEFVGVDESQRGLGIATSLINAASKDYALYGKPESDSGLRLIKKLGATQEKPKAEWIEMQEPAWDGTAKEDMETEGYDPLGTWLVPSRAKNDAPSPKGVSLLDGIGGKPKAKAGATSSTETKAFKKWFGDSKVVDEDGKPLSVFHGSSKQFYSFDMKESSGMIWLAGNKEYADGFAAKDNKPHELYASILNPLEVNLHGEEKSLKEWQDILSEAGIDVNKIDWDKIDFAPDYGMYYFYDLFPHSGNGHADGGMVAAIKDAGYDGIYAPPEKQGDLSSGKTFVAFSPEQVKSVDNHGTWDVTNSDIRLKRDAGRKFTIPDAEVQERIEKARGVPQTKLKEKLQEVLEEIYRKGHREFEHLPRTGEFSQLRNGLLKLRKAKGIAADKTLKNLDAITKDLNEYEYDTFSHKVIFDDLSHEYEENHLLPFGLTEENFEDIKSYIDEEVARQPKVQVAIYKRNKVWKEAKDDYIKAQKAVGFNVDGRMTKEDYFHHQVLEYANAKGVMGTGKKLRIATGRGFLKKRGGSSFDINSDYLQAEFEVMAQMYVDIEASKLIKVVKDEHDVISQLKKEATAQNDAEMIDFFRGMMERNEIEGDPGKMYRQTLNKKQAIAYSRLYKLAAEGELPIGEKGEYTGIVDAMAEAYWEARAANTEDETGEGTFSAGSFLSSEMRSPLEKYLNYLAKQDTSDAGKKLARTVYKGRAEKTRAIQNTLGDKYLVWQDLVPDGYVAWQPREGHMFYMANSIPEGIAEQLFYGLVEEVGITADMLKKEMVFGQKYPEMVVPEEVALTLDEMYGKMRSPVVDLLYYKPYRFWKQWQLISPRRYFKYNIRNITGDADGVLAGNPSAFKRLPQAWSDLYQAFFTKDKVFSEELQMWFEQGGFETLMQAQEINDINRNRQFKHLMESKMKKTIPQKIADSPRTAWNFYWDGVRATTDFREALLRYATFLDYREQIMNDPNGKPKNFGASNRDEIMALATAEDKAAKLANELLGAYDEVSVIGTWLADHLIPFWRWNEVNFVRYVRLFKNAQQDGRLMAAIAGKATGMAIRSPIIAGKIAMFVCKASLLTAVITAWNLLFFRDEEDELPEDVRNRLHIVLGRDKNGKVRYFSRLGALQDFVDWFGMDTPIKTAQDFLSGRKSVKEIAIDLAKEDTNKLVTAITPVITLPVEMATEKKTFPDIFNMMPIRDRWQHLADSFGLGNEYKALTGKPTRGYANSLADLFVYKSDPYETAYFANKENVKRFKIKNGTHTEGYSESARSDALYNLRLSMRYGDKEAYKKYLAEYKAKGGTKQGMQTSLRNMAPLAGLAGAQKRAYIESLDADGKKNLAKAEKHYQNMLNWKKMND